MGGTMTLRVSPLRHPSRSACALLFVAWAAALLGWTPAARSATPSSLIVIPRPASGPDLSYFKLARQPARVGSAGAIEVRNPTPRPLRVVLAPVDGQTIDTLGSTYAPAGSQPSGSTRWLRIG